MPNPLPASPALDAREKFADRWRFLPEAEAISGPQGGFCAVYRDRWWVCHPEHGLTFFWSRGVKGLGSPQCNASENIAVRLGKPVWAVLKFLPVVFVPISLADYQ